MLDHNPPPHHHKLACNFFGLMAIVSCHNDCCCGLPVECHDQIIDKSRMLFVDRGGRLIQKQHIWLQCKRTGNAQSLGFSARQGSRILPDFMDQSYGNERLLHPFRDKGAFAPRIRRP